MILFFLGDMNLSIFLKTIRYFKEGLSVFGCLKNMRLSLCSLILLCSCNTNRIIYYNYKGITITRINNDAESRFYYGSYSRSEAENINSYIDVSYNGFNNGMDLYIFFHKDSSVEIIPYGIGDVIQKWNRNNLFYISDYDNHALDSV